MIMVVVFLVGGWERELEGGKRGVGGWCDDVRFVCSLLELYIV